MLTALTQLHLHDLIGMIGVTLLLLAYFLIQSGRLNAQSLLFYSLNLAGALLIIVSLLFAFNLATFLIECFWALISLMGIYKSRKLS